MPTLDPAAIEDAIVGCAMPEGEQGLNFARTSVLLAGLPNSVGGITVNRFCASGLSAVQMAADRIRVGEADVMIAAGAESMSMVPMSGNKPSFNPHVFDKDENIGIAYGMGLTAEKVADKWKVSREAQDAFALASHQKALKAIADGQFKDEITPVEVFTRTPDLATGEIDGHQPHGRHRRGPAPRHLARRPGQAEGRVRRQGQRHRRQQLADQRRRRLPDPVQREGRSSSST